MSCLEIIDAFEPYYDGRAPFACAGTNRPAPAATALPGKDRFVPDMNDMAVRRRKPAVTGTDGD